MEFMESRRRRQNRKPLLGDPKEGDANMYCTQCGHKLMDGSRVCSQCGSPANAGNLARPSSTKGFQLVKTVELEPAKNEIPTSFKAAMDTIKVQSKRHIPLIIIGALILSLLVSTAFAEYYGSISSRSGKLPDDFEFVSDGGATAWDPAAVAYEEILDEYRAFIAYLEGGGDINSLERDPTTSLPVDYPDVNVIGFIDFANREGSCVQYAYADLNDDDIDELLIGLNDPELSISTVIQGFTYHNWEVKELFESVYRDRWYVEGNGYFNEFASGGADVYDLTKYAVDPAAENGRRFVESLSYEPIDWSNRMNDDSLYRVTRETPEGTEEFMATYAEMLQMTSDFGSEYTSGGEEIVLDWQDL